MAQGEPGAQFIAWCGTIGNFRLSVSPFQAG